MFGFGAGMLENLPAALARQFGRRGRGERRPIAFPKLSTVGYLVEMRSKSELVAGCRMSDLYEID